MTKRELIWTVAMASLAAPFASAQAKRAPSPQPAAKATPASTPAPAPPGPESLTETAGRLCDAAFGAVAGTGRPEGPVAVFLRSEGGAWKYTPYQVAAVSTPQAAAVKTLACVDERYVDVGRKYTDGASAFSCDWTVRLVRVSDGKALGSEDFTNYAPDSKSYSAAGRGSPPADQFGRWLAEVIGRGAIVSGAEIHAIAFLPGPRIATNGADDTVRILDWATGAEGQVLAVKGLLVRSLSVSADAARMVGSYSGWFRIWQLGGGNPIEPPPKQGFGGPVAISPNGALLAVRKENDLLLWDVALGRGRVTFKRPAGYDRFGISQGAFSADGRYLGFAGTGGTGLVDVASAKLIRMIRVGGGDAVAFSADSSRVFAVTKVWDRSTGNDTTYADLVDVATGKTLSTHVVDALYTSAFAISPDATRIAITSVSGPVKVLDTSTGAEVATFKPSAIGGRLQQAITTLAFSPDGRTMVVGAGNVMWPFELSGATAKPQ